MPVNNSGPLYSVFMYILTIKDYAGISDSHGVHGNTSVVSIVFFRDVEKDEHRLFTLILYLNPIWSIEEPVRKMGAAF